MKSRQQNTPQAWRKWHCLWHLFAGIGLSYAYIQEYMLKNGIIGKNIWWPW